MSVVWCGFARFIQHPFPKVRNTQLVLLWASGWRGRAGMHCPVGRAAQTGEEEEGDSGTAARLCTNPTEGHLSPGPVLSAIVGSYTLAATRTCRHACFWTRPGGCPPAELDCLSLCGSKGTARRSGIGNRRSVEQPVADVLPSGLLL